VQQLPPVNVQGATISIPGQMITVAGGTVNVAGPTVTVAGGTVNIAGPTVTIPGNLVPVYAAAATPAPVFSSAGSFVTTPYSPYYQGNTNSICPSGYFNVITETTCLAAAVSYRLEYKGQRFDSSAYGCFYDNGSSGGAIGVYLNLVAPVTSSGRAYAPLCSLTFGGRRSHQAPASAPEQPQGPSALAVALGSLVAIVVIVASVVVVFNRVVNKLVEAELRAEQA